MSVPTVAVHIVAETMTHKSILVEHRHHKTIFSEQKFFMYIELYFVINTKTCAWLSQNVYL